jgi:hypothetical protein
MDEFLENFLKDDKEAPKEKSHATFNDLNKELQKLLLSQ